MNLEQETKIPRTGLARSADVFAMTAGIQKGDEEAFNRFYRAYFDRIHRYLLAISGGQEDVANEALQDTMIRVIRYMKPLQDEASLWNRLRRIARTALIDHARKTKGLELSAALTFWDSVEATGEETDPSERLKELLDACLDILDAEERNLIEGKYMQGRSYEALARDRGTTPKAVESRLARIRKKLKSMIMERLKNE